MGIFNHMFSYFKGGIQDKYLNRHIDLPSLVKLIKNNPEKFKIEKVRELRRTGMDYSTPKSYLPYITPNCLVKIRNLKESDYNLIAPSSYIYFDIDDYPNSQQLKDRLIVEYGQVASLICISCSGGGISIFFKVSNNLKNENDFLIARQYIIDNILVNEKIDTNAGGIARAMFTRPHLLVLDEATSSLDGETESSISNAINELRGSTTVVMIAHRLSTVRNADLVVYLDEGQVLSKGTFDEVRRSVPDFDRQAKLMGL